MFVVDSLILVAGILLLLGILSSKISARLGVPVLVLFLLLGMIAGSEGIGGLEFENYPLAHGIGSLALALILFDGGLSTSLSTANLVWKPAAILATFGVLVTSVITGLAAAWILQISWLEGLLLGSIVGSTDAAAVFSVLRSGGIGLSKRMAAILELESASNDPMAIFLTIGCIEVLLGNVTLGPSLLGLFASQMIIGSLCGVAAGYASGWIVNRVELSAAGLYPVLITACCLLTYGVTANLGGSGFLAVYLCGLVAGNRPLVFHNGIRQFHDAVAWLAQIVMFVVLGLLCFPSRLFEVAGKGVLVGVVMIFIARPLAVFLSASYFRFNWRELTFLSWVGLKGAVPITLATFPLMLATPDKPLSAPLIFDVVFFIVVVSAILQGSSLAPVARWLGLERPRAPEPPVSLEINSLRHVNGEIVDYSIGEDSRAAGRLIKDLSLPDGAVIALIARDENIIPPQGNTRILAGDHVILVLRPGIQPIVNQIFAKDSQERGELPTSIEFPLRPGTKVSELEAIYSLKVNAASEKTIGEILQDAIEREGANPGDPMRFGQVQLRAMRRGAGGAIELVGVSICPGVLPPESSDEEPARSKPSSAMDR